MSSSSSHYLSCPICSSSFHRSLIERHVRNCGVTNECSSSSFSSSAATTTPAPPIPPTTTTPSNYGPLRPGTSADLGPKRKRGLDRPSQEYRHLVILDFEWTCDNKKPVLPHAEIIEFSCVLVSTHPRPASIIAEFQQYVIPEHNPKLSKFAITLTGITQAQIDTIGVPLKVAIRRFHCWLKDQSIQLNYYPDLSEKKQRSHSQQLPFAICTWSDADLGSTLPRQMDALSLTRTPWFDKWINLKLAYTSVYKKSNSNLQKCLERIGLKFIGRAHSGLIDSINTASIVLDMINKQNYRFTRCTRYLLKDEWRMVGSRSSSSSSTDDVRKRSKVK